MEQETAKILKMFPDGEFLLNSVQIHISIDQLEITSCANQINPSSFCYIGDISLFNAFRLWLAMHTSIAYLICISFNPLIQFQILKFCGKFLNETFPNVNNENPFKNHEGQKSK